MADTDALDSWAELRKKLDEDNALILDALRSEASRRRKIADKLIDSEDLQATDADIVELLRTAKRLEAIADTSQRLDKTPIKLDAPFQLRSGEPLIGFGDALNKLSAEGYQKGLADPEDTQGSILAPDAPVDRAEPLIKCDTCSHLQDAHEAEQVTTNPAATCEDCWDCADAADAAKDRATP